MFFSYSDCKCLKAVGIYMLNLNVIKWRLIIQNNLIVFSWELTEPSTEQRDR